ncbi:hypothetical protein [Chitinophaga barathri]|uniref:Uncharacterized protein n=1 Tax=Chitinophaga barathri TaxID=1647451 RepID=A0A3N4MGN2_9BACT|nr:hypothetical protein [Chitinophaga barathri]RPD43124.1 hypothetical protein EG028_02180 [Chitinophaga barathri]
MYSESHEGIIAETNWSCDELGIILSVSTHQLPLTPPGPRGELTELTGFYFRPYLGWVLISYRGYRSACQFCAHEMPSRIEWPLSIMQLNVTNHTTQETEKMAYLLTDAARRQMRDMLEKQRLRYRNATDLAAEYNAVENIVPVSFMFFMAGLPSLSGGRTTLPL